MPELPEVERTAKLVRTVAQGRVIQAIETFEDTIVFEEPREEFSKECKGRRVLDAKRYGKYFWLQLEGTGKMPLLHLGMTGYLQVKGVEPFKYVHKMKITDEWPPRFVKFILTFESANGQAETSLAFCDPRRLGRIKLRTSPMTEPPISTLGFDPLLSLPSLEQYSVSVRKRKCPIKALLLDQSFNAGVGNWVADEILYHSGVHPERRCNSLTDAEVQQLLDNTKYVCQAAVDVDAESSRFPSHWLFLHRWGKGKKGKEKGKNMMLTDGRPATIKWLTVGGRTSAFVVEMQKLSGAIKQEVKTKSRTRKVRLAQHRQADSLHELQARKKEESDEDDESMNDA